MARMTRMTRVLLLGVGAAAILGVGLPLLLNLWPHANGSVQCGYGAPTAPQYAADAAISWHLEANYPFDDRRQVDATKTGKTFFTQPGCVSEVTVYEVTSPADQERLEQVAREALRLAKVNRVRLTFRRAQHFNEARTHRLSEEVLKHVLVTRNGGRSALQITPAAGQRPGC